MRCGHTGEAGVVASPSRGWDLRGKLTLVCATAAIVAGQATAPAAPAAAVAAAACTQPGAINPQGLPCRPAADGSLHWGPRYPILYYGDSIAREAQPFFTAMITRSGAATVTAHTFPGTAPCDFSTAMTSEGKRVKQPIVVMSFYGNVLTSCVKSAYGRWAKRATGSTWASTYREQLAQAVDRFPKAIAIFIAVAPTAQGQSRSDYDGLIRRRSAREIADSIAAGDRRVTVVDAGAAVNDPNGGFSLFLPCVADEPCTSRSRPGYNQVRSSDRLHLCPGTHSNYYLHCSRYASGAMRYGQALAAPVAGAFGL